MIHPLEAGLIQAARLTHPGGVIQGHGLRLYPADKEEHGFLPCLSYELRKYHEKIFSTCRKGAVCETFRSKNILSEVS